MAVVHMIDAAIMSEVRMRYHLGTFADSTLIGYRVSHATTSGDDVTFSYSYVT